MSTEMPDLAAVRIHSKTISIFSSRPIISRKRCTEGDWSSVLIWRGVHSCRAAATSRRRRTLRDVARRQAGMQRDAEFNQLVETVVDVEPHASNADISLDFEAVGTRASGSAAVPRGGDCTRLHHAPRRSRFVACRRRGACDLVHGSFAHIGRSRSCRRRGRWRSAGPLPGKLAPCPIVLPARREEPRRHLSGRPIRNHCPAAARCSSLTVGSRPSTALSEACHIPRDLDPATTPPSA
jgi:hypothetical protein